MKPISFPRAYPIAEVRAVRLCEPPSIPVADTPEKVFGLWNLLVATAPWFDPEKEQLVVFGFNTRFRCLFVNLVAVGSINEVHVTAAGVFRPVVAGGAHHCIVAHNHPSGNPSPSEGDVRVTRELCRAGNVLKTELTDHLIIGSTEHHPTGFVSLRELGYF